MNFSYRLVQISEISLLDLYFFKIVLYKYLKNLLDYIVEDFENTFQSWKF